VKFGVGVKVKFIAPPDTISVILEVVFTASHFIIISLFIQQQNSTNTVTNVNTNEVETGLVLDWYKNQNSTAEYTQTK